MIAFEALGRAARREGRPISPILDEEVQDALAGLPVGSQEGRDIMKAFIDGWVSESLQEEVN
jgi:hypothetical protein